MQFTDAGNPTFVLFGFSDASYQGGLSCGDAIMRLYKKKIHFR
jgi:hypothetical protein